MGKSMQARKNDGFVRALNGESFKMGRLSDGELEIVSMALKQVHSGVSMSELKDKMEHVRDAAPMNSDHRLGGELVLKHINSYN